MTDKEKFRKEVEKLKSNLIHGACSSQIAMETRCKEEAYNEVLAILDTMQEEPVNRTPSDVESAMQEVEEKSKVFTDAHKGEDADTILAQMRGEEPVSKDYRERYKRITQSEQFKKSYEGMSVGEVMPIEGEEPVNEDLEEVAKNYGNKKHPMTKIGANESADDFKAGAKWQKERDEDEIRIIRELLDNFDKTCDEYHDAGFKHGQEALMKDATETTVHIGAGNYPYIPQIELYDYDKDVPLAKEGDKYKVVLIKED